MSNRAKRVAVTGSGSGIGAATAALLARQGWRVVGLDRNPEPSPPPGEVETITLDVAVEADVRRVFADIEARMGGLDALVTAAGIYETTPFFETNAEIFSRLLAVNVIGTFLCLREGARMMARGARICTVASVAGLRGGGLAGTVSYASTKGAVLALTKNAARELGPKGIAVNTIAPGMIETPFAAVPLSDPTIRARIEGMTSFGRLGSAEEIAEAIAWLISPSASYVHGATLVADGGMAMY
ncbi:MAG TPA: SDR family oxidoreductase [Acetobacteraceae bacterium]|nr:SDR family oxidoreductase [Acetobacteraceae bacterium]